jgi:hypothetical protein
MVNNDSSFPGSRDFADLATRSLDDFDRAACSIGRLEQIGLVADDDLRKGTDQMLRNLSYRAREARPLRPQPTKPDTRLNAMSSSLEPRLLRAHALLAPRTVESPTVLWLWSWTSLAVVGVMCWAAHTNHWVAATALVLLRSVGSMFAGTAGFPTAKQPDPPVGAPSRVLRCVMSHLGDALGLVGVGFALSADDRPVWGLVMSCAALLMLTATLTRVAAVQVGLVVNRKATERVIRRLSLGLGFIAMAAAGGVATNGVPPVVIAAIGPSIYAAVELWRVASILLSMKPRSVILDVGVDGVWEQQEIYRDPNMPPVRPPALSLV